ncbi:MAG: tRNA (adenosine(37)-N6)-threonylcarbamoyltransferase complex ATPase subunit type 1 TsaE [Bacteroidia bacterium]
MEKKEFILGEDKLASSADELLAFAGERKLFLFHAEMGAGKTTFIKALCSRLGVKETMSSPTYSIVNEYRTENGKKIYHFDLYRLKTMEECLDIGIEEYLSSGAYCFIEWPEIAKALIPSNFVSVNIVVSNNIRYLSVSKF